MPVPGSRINVENLIFFVPRIKFELYFGDTVKSDTLQEPPARRLHDRLARRFYKRAGITKLNRILPPALGYERGIYTPVFADCTKGKLIFSPPGNSFLDQNFLRRNVPAHLSKSSLQLRTVVGRQSLNVCLWKEMMIDCG